jgi:hypothetical protein
MKHRGAASRRCQVRFKFRINTLMIAAGLALCQVGLAQQRVCKRDGSATFADLCVFARNLKRQVRVSRQVAEIRKGAKIAKTQR